MQQGQSSVPYSAAYTRETPLATSLSSNRREPPPYPGPGLYQHAGFRQSYASSEAGSTDLSLSSCENLGPHGNYYRPSNLDPCGTNWAAENSRNIARTTVEGNPTNVNAFYMTGEDTASIPNYSGVMHQVGYVTDSDRSRSATPGAQSATYPLTACRPMVSGQSTPNSGYCPSVMDVYPVVSRPVSAGSFRGGLASGYGAESSSTLPTSTPSTPDHLIAAASPFLNCFTPQQHVPNQQGMVQHQGMGNQQTVMQQQSPRNVSMSQQHQQPPPPPQYHPLPTSPTSHLPQQYYSQNSSVPHSMSSNNPASNVSQVSAFATQPSGIPCYTNSDSNAMLSRPQQQCNNSNINPNNNTQHMLNQRNANRHQQQQPNYQTQMLSQDSYEHGMAQNHPHHHPQTNQERFFPTNRHHDNNHGNMNQPHGQYFTGETEGIVQQDNSSLQQIANYPGANTSDQERTLHESDAEAKQDPYEKWRHFYVNQKSQLNQCRILADPVGNNSSSNKENEDSNTSASLHDNCRDSSTSEISSQNKQLKNSPLKLSKSPSGSHISTSNNSNKATVMKQHPQIEQINALRAAERLRSATPDMVSERPAVSRQLPLRPSSANTPSRQLQQRLGQRGKGGAISYLTPPGNGYGMNSSSPDRTSDVREGNSGSNIPGPSGIPSRVQSSFTHLKQQKTAVKTAVVSSNESQNQCAISNTNVQDTQNVQSPQSSGQSPGKPWPSPLTAVGFKQKKSCRQSGFTQAELEDALSTISNVSSVSNLSTSSSEIEPNRSELGRAMLMMNRQRSSSGGPGGRVPTKSNLAVKTGSKPGANTQQSLIAKGSSPTPAYHRDSYQQYQSPESRPKPRNTSPHSALSSNISSPKPVSKLAAQKQAFQAALSRFTDQSPSRKPPQDNKNCGDALQPLNNSGAVGFTNEKSPRVSARNSNQSRSGSKLQRPRTAPSQRIGEKLQVLNFSNKLSTPQDSNIGKPFRKSSYNESPVLKQLNSSFGAKGNTKTLGESSKELSRSCEMLNSNSNLFDSSDPSSSADRSRIENEDLDLSLSLEDPDLQLSRGTSLPCSSSLQQQQQQSKQQPDSTQISTTVNTKTGGKTNANNDSNKHGMYFSTTTPPSSGANSPSGGPTTRFSSAIKGNEQLKYTSSHFNTPDGNNKSLTSPDNHVNRKTLSLMNNGEVDHVAIATRATQMVERLSEENQALRLDLEAQQAKVAKLQKMVERLSKENQALRLDLEAQQAKVAKLHKLNTCRNTRATQMLERLSEENQALRLDLESQQGKVAKLQKFESDVSRVCDEHENLMKEAQQQALVEKSMRLKLSAEIKKLKQQNTQLKEQLGQQDSSELYGPASPVLNIEADLRRELREKDTMLTKLITQNRELQKLRDRLDIELAGERVRNEERMNHIQSLEKTLKNCQLQVYKLEEEVGRLKIRETKVEQLQTALASHRLATEKREAIEQKLRNKLEEEIRMYRHNYKAGKGSKASDTDEGISSDTDCPTRVHSLLRQMSEREQQVLQLQSQLAHWEQRFYEQSALNILNTGAADLSSNPLERSSSQDAAERLIEESRTDRLKYLEEIYTAKRSTAELEARVKTLEMQLAEREAMVRILNRHHIGSLATTCSTISRTSSQTSLVSSCASPTPSLTSLPGAEVGSLNTAGFFAATGQAFATPSGGSMQHPASLAHSAVFYAKARKSERDAGNQSPMQAVKLNKTAKEIETGSTASVAKSSGGSVCLNRSLDGDSSSPTVTSQCNDPLALGFPTPPQPQRLSAPLVSTVATSSTSTGVVSAASKDEKLTHCVSIVENQQPVKSGEDPKTTTQTTTNSRPVSAQVTSVSKQPVLNNQSRPMSAQAVSSLARPLAATPASVISAQCRTDGERDTQTTTQGGSLTPKLPHRELTKVAVHPKSNSDGAILDLALPASSEATDGRSPLAGGAVTSSGRSANQQSRHNKLEPMPLDLRMKLAAQAAIFKNWQKEDPGDLKKDVYQV